MPHLLKFSFVSFPALSMLDLSDVTCVVFIDENLEVGASSAPLLSGMDREQIARAAADCGFCGKADETMTLHATGDDHTRRIVFLGVGNNVQAEKPINLGGRAAASVGFASKVVIASELPHGRVLTPEEAAEIALGFRLRSYRFNTYRTRRPEVQLPADRLVTMLSASSNEAEAAFSRQMALAEGVELARTLVNEPANVLTPPEFVRRIKTLGEAGLDIEILRAADLERLGFGALLAVGHGSAEESHVAIMRWHGAADKTAPPFAFIGKGVCFDTGGICIKSARDMADMKGDMAGAAAVTGLMLALARGKVRVNAIGAVGLVENMPDARAQRPGDIIRSLSGQTIEVVDTDSEGRMVLADLLWHVQANFRPRFMIDLATLTDAVVVGIGRNHAGLFSNSDSLAGQLVQASSASGELVWRLPMEPDFNREMDSKIADVRNNDPVFGGGCTAANFLQRFVNGVTWAHLDFCGPAQGMPDSPINVSWGTGWGVRLLNRLVLNLEEPLDGVH